MDQTCRFDGPARAVTTARSTEPFGVTDPLPS
jgi:hypothetical protein